MLKLRRATERGHFDWGWLDTWHTFSFGDYRDPAHKGFGTLRVINEDRVRGGGGFETHGHRDMEIVTYVMSGALEHADSMGNRHVIRAGEVQHMTAGRGVQHSEKNHSATDLAHFLQIWILPQQRGGDPQYQQRSYAEPLSHGDPVKVASLPPQAEIWAHKPRGAWTRSWTVEAQRGLWIQIVQGTVSTGDGQTLEAGDGAAIWGPQAGVELSGRGPAEYLVLDVSLL